MTHQHVPIFKKASPTTPQRGVHLDLKGLPPPFPHLLEWVDLFARLRLNIILVEWEDTFPWDCDPRLRGRTYYTRAEIRRFAAACDAHGIEIIPLVQSLGHAENVLGKPGYELLRELPHRTDVFHPLHPDSSRIVCQMIEEVIAFLPNIKRFHLGGDEADTLGQNPASKAYAAEYGMPALYRQQLEPLIEMLESHSIRPILWHDELVDWPMEDLATFARRIDLMVWGYTGDPRDSATYHYRLPHAEKLHAAGYQLWAASAYKGANGAGSNRPIPSRLQMATQGWVDLHERFSWAGVIATGWSRYASGRIQTEPMDAALDSLVNTAVILHDGVPPEDGLETCIAWLDTQAEGSGFRECKAAMEELTLRVDKAWEWIRHLEEQAALLEAEPGRAQSGIEEVLFNLLQTEVHALDGIALRVEKSLRGKVMEPWASQYHQVRRQPIKTAAARLQTLLNGIGCLEPLGLTETF